MQYIITARQRSCGKVMFLHLSVIMFTGGASPFWTWIETPLDRNHLHRNPLDRNSPGQRPPTQKPPWQKLSWTETPWTETPGQRPITQRPPRETSRETFGIHPTRMHTCYFVRQLFTFTRMGRWIIMQVGMLHLIPEIIAPESAESKFCLMYT